MTLRLHYHPLSSFCWKALIALDEAGARFEPALVDLSNAEARRAFEALWPIGKFPVLEDRARNAVIGESTAIIEYLDAFHDAALTPTAPDAACRARMLDRVLDNYIHLPMQKITGDGRRAPDARDPQGVAEAVALTERAYAYLETQTPESGWMMDERFGLVECAALPALFYGDLSVPITRAYPRLRAYLRRLIDRPSVARTLAAAEPYFGYFPTEPKPDIAAAGRR